MFFETGVMVFLRLRMQSDTAHRFFICLPLKGFWLNALFFVRA
jgi:hypothetical protein